MVVPIATLCYIHPEYVCGVFGSLWELFCTVETGCHFSIALGPAQRKAFEDALRGDYSVLLKVLAHINVEDAKAGKEEDRVMILNEVQATVGCSELNARAMREVRRWILQTVQETVARWHEKGDWGGVRHVANLLAMLGEYAEARRLLEEAILGRTDKLGESHTSTLKTKMDLAVVFISLGERDKARQLLEDVVREAMQSSLGRATETH